MFGRLRNNFLLKWNYILNDLVLLSPVNIDYGSGECNTNRRV